MDAPNGESIIAKDSVSEDTFYQQLQPLVASTGLALAMWRLPQSAEKNIILSKSVRSFQITDDEVENLEPGFVFAPYDKHKDGYFLLADYRFRVKGDKLQDPQSPAETNAHKWFEHERRESGKTRIKGVQVPTVRSVDEEAYVALVQKCLNEIESGTAEKIVPSRFRSIPLPTEFDPLDAFRKLSDSFPNAMVSLVYIPDVGCWIGASPELLVSVDSEQMFHTVALAGTQPYKDGMNLKSVAWTQKEIEEQALVERYIISCFKKIRLREYDEQGPKTVVAGNLLHLRSDFKVNLAETHFPQLATTMLRLLHPTSAVCGMPHEEASAFLAREENYDRSFYAGFLGPVNIDSALSLYVNLRCMQVTQGQVILYAGAGVTADSDPVSEWKETEVKLDTLINILV